MPAFKGLLIASVVAFLCAQPGFGQGVDERIPQSIRFDGEMVVRVQLESEADFRFMETISEDVWSHHIVQGPVDFRISRSDLPALDGSGLEYEVLIADVQALIEAERAGQGVDGDFFSQYQNFNSVVSYLNTLAALRPDLARVESIGQSVQDREIWAIRISSPGSEPGKPALVFNGCIHAREWITVMATMWTADRLVREYGSDADVTFMLDNYEIIIIPVLNPDGYVYTWTNNRMWRKNRSSNSDGSRGVDLNRNWGYKWGGRGASTSPNSDTYRGPGPFSEPETTALAEFVRANPQIVGGIDIHSYSQLILHPWGYTIQLCDDHDEFQALGDQMEAAMEAEHGTQWINGPVYTTIYPASGVTSDWYYGERGMYGLSYELRDRGQYGFTLPASQIVPASEETFAGIVELARWPINVPPVLDVLGDLVRGENATVRYARGIPNEDVYFYYSIRDQEGTTYIPFLDVTLDIPQASLAGSAAADEHGQATLVTTVPRNIPILVIWLQGAQTGITSNVVLDQIN